MNDILSYIDDLKEIRNLITGGDVEGAVKKIEEAIAYKQKEVEAFDKWAEVESQKDTNLQPDLFQEGVG